MKRSYDTELYDTAKRFKSFVVDTSNASANWEAADRERQLKHILEQNKAFKEENEKLRKLNFEVGSNAMQQMEELHKLRHTAHILHHENTDLRKLLSMPNTHREMSEIKNVHDELETYVKFYKKTIELRIIEENYAIKLLNYTL